MRPQFPDRSSLYAKRVLLIDRCQATREARVAVLRSRGVEVDEAEELWDARSLWQDGVYHLILLDVRRYSPGEVLEFYEQIKSMSPRQRFAFLVGAPDYVSLQWPGELTVEATPRGQWAQTVKRFLAAA